MYLKRLLFDEDVEGSQKKDLQILSRIRARERAPLLECTEKSIFLQFFNKRAYFDKFILKRIVIFFDYNTFWNRHGSFAIAPNRQFFFGIYMIIVSFSKLSVGHELCSAMRICASWKCGQANLFYYNLYQTNSVLISCQLLF